jgi:EAL domain-containing protein (putative c-di-GMP-specific phosphodiesterase class I)
MLDRRLIGFEALIRLPAKDGTLVAPLVFIPVAEDLRLIDKIGAWVLREACRTAATWPDHLTVAVNLSPAQFLTGSVTGVVAAALKETGLAAHRLELEITETLLLGNTQAILGAAGSQGDGRGNRDGRFRDRLFEPQLSVALSVRQDQD